MSVERDSREGDTCHRVDSRRGGAGLSWREAAHPCGGGGAAAGRLRGWVCGLPVGGGRPAVRGKGGGEERGSCCPAGREAGQRGARGQIEGR